MLDKLMITGSAMSPKCSKAFSVRFGNDRANSLAVKPLEALRKLRNELSTLTAMGPTVMTMERDGKGMLHLHGVVVTDASQAEVKKTLQVLGGKTTNNMFRNIFQVRIKPVHSMCCWIQYMTKDLIKLPPELRDSYIYMSQSATRLGRNQMQVLGQLATQKLGVKSDWRGKSTVYTSSRTCVRASSVAGRTLH